MQFREQFPDDAACLAFIWNQRHPNGAACRCGKVGQFYPVKGRRSYACVCGKQQYPTEGTIFHKSPTKLTSWFFAMFLMTASKNGVSAKELERQLGVTYKCAWRMAHQIRKLMLQGSWGTKMTGTVEADETYIGGRRRMNADRMGNKTAVVGMVQRGGEVRAKAVHMVNAWQLKQILDANLDKSADLMTDELRAYTKLAKAYHSHETVNHGHFEYVRADVHTNSVEGFWSQLKRSIHGTFHKVSREYLQAYVNEFCFRYNHRKDVRPIFASLASGVAQRHSLTV